MTFLTPTLLAGDRSLVDVVAHELAHSWTGNLVTNATMEHFWLNEGFTVWAERRILETLHGEDAVGAGAGPSARRRSTIRLARFGADSAADQAAHRAAGRRPRRRLLVHPLREGRPLRGAPRAHRRARAIRPLHARLHGDASASLPSRPRSSWRSWSSSCPALAAAGGRAGVALRAPACRPTHRSSARRRSSELTALAERLGRRARARRPSRPRPWSPIGAADLPAAPAARAAGGRCQWLDASPGPDGARQLRDPGGVADDRLWLGLRAGLRPDARGADARRAA